ncbi:MAG: hypothetical protein CM15mP74_31590 [Halieaceae bacterium]|nr:MAG: hypothetical protein CM15mP74_31590 [Halieaceae bacterium]
MLMIWSQEVIGPLIGTGVEFRHRDYRGIDVFALMPSEYLTANEIAAAELADQVPYSILSSNIRSRGPPTPSSAWLIWINSSGPDRRSPSTLAPLYETLATPATH